jgi:hypothetical protein
MKHILFLLFILISVLVFSHKAMAVGESAVITLVFPFGVSGLGMGETGTAIGQDFSAPFYNPALLGFRNNRWHRGEFGFFHEPILPAFGLTDLWHDAYAACYQPWHMDAGGFGFFINYLNFGKNQWMDNYGAMTESYHSFETVLAASWGTVLGKPGKEYNAVGVSVKYAYSALAPGSGDKGDGVGRTFAIDAGYAFFHRPTGIRAGLTFMNMGPAISYIQCDEQDPLPFEINIAAGYDRIWKSAGFDFLRLRSELRIQREIVTTYSDRNPDPFYRALWTDLVTDTADRWYEELLEDDVIYHIGAELTGINTFSTRFGFMEDPAGERREITFGLGASLMNHFQVDWSIIKEPNRAGSERVRTGQWRINFLVKSIFYWKEQDLFWWKTIAENY